MPFALLHSIVWVCGLLLGVIPVIKHHRFGADELSLYLGPSYFGSHILIMLGAAAVGSMVWGGLARWLGSGDREAIHSTMWLKVTLAAQVLVGVMGACNVVTGYGYLALWFGVIVAISAGAMKLSRHPKPTINDFRSAVAWMRRPKPWNALFFLALYLLLMWHNLYLIERMTEIDGWHKLSLFVNRAFSQLALTGGFYFVIQLSIQNGPLWSRKVIWSLATLAPIAIVLDHFIVGFWNQTLLDFLNNFGWDGLMNLEEELRGGGVEMSVPAAVALGLAVFFGACALTWATIWISHKVRFRMAPVWALLAIALGFFGAAIEQTVGREWKARRSWMQEYNEFSVMISPVRPPEGLAYFDVKFRDHAGLQELDALKLERKPDIYVIFLESLRADALTPEVTPFLYQFKSRECQPIGRGWSSSNGTHLGWFGTLSGQVPIHWEDERDEAREQGWPGLRTFHLFKDAGYKMRVHAASELEFRDMGPHFFSTGDELFEAVRENVEGDPIFGLPLPERERVLMEDLKAQIAGRPVGGHLDIVAIDSPHFMYTWHEDFELPFPDYYESRYFPAFPSDEEVRLVKNKYFNSVAWADHLVEGFCQFLKESGRYDDSIVIVLGDHGEEFQDHGGWLHVSSLEDEQVRVPMMIKWPASYGRGPLVDDASQLDVLPSLLDYLTDGNPPKDMAGISLLSGEGRSIVATTAQGGSTREAMLLSRDGYKAYFTWPSYWNGRPTDQITLSRFIGPEGDIEFDTEAEYLEAMRKHMPDALDRFFLRVELRRDPAEE
ncbi:sulfatase-like hydrolase/transferase [Sulfuriroseicoccus oceanibius]|uniref:Sulfatase-like hydrolase/transferase n=1 Tax=Sulfuriroseicoccus oceanibius TaxID=2707525 RepID=A0A6B3LBY1_9BACT|nr:sulfatase-like hydrolase/transferase [Sulfuriroseicoccus oceanibius]QQL45147.1 sulfatase-like hydrolase/transferase [Sulfuriroseicoccus oceanibius]